MRIRSSAGFILSKKAMMHDLYGTGSYITDKKDTMEDFSFLRGKVEIDRTLHQDPDKFFHFALLSVLYQLHDRLTLTP